ncbi:MAG: D-tyrosyl-tRNA(Tyr) deacylase [Cryomorphaceae bacterium]|nr:D-tyrosyl-tRNA(Tyr) deacylase [Cryomorphaceae bacterium]
MRALVQRVKNAKVVIDTKTVGEINAGMLIFLGIESEDSEADVAWLSHKLSGLRIFSDDQGKMNLSLMDCGASALIVSQFTLHASTKKGFRPSFVKAAHPDHALPIYQKFISDMQHSLGEDKVACGVFGAMMDVHLCNDGPVTIMLDTKTKE